MFHEGKHLILEINDTASGFAKENEDVDNGYVCDLLIEEMNKISDK